MRPLAWLTAGITNQTLGKPEPYKKKEKKKKMATINTHGVSQTDENPDSRKGMQRLSLLQARLTHTDHQGRIEAPFVEQN